MTRLFKASNLAPSPRRDRTPATILDLMTPSVRESLSEYQLTEMERLIALALPKPAPKIVDLRFDIDLLVSRFYVVLFVGKDRRQSVRQHSVSPLTVIGNWLTAIVLLLGVNLAVSLAVMLLAYLVKSALGINLFPGHFRGFGK
ncbi:hypothetical protein C7271_11665 [filamentous cyanobacterium CCP5]|nr:hypothetical protein C7271_11665 [filamentous cyanobacterium CCP5]